MFDEFVEHAAVAGGPAPVQHLEYEGFEPTPEVYLGNPDEAEQPNLDPNAANAPIFDLGRVQYAFPAPLVSMAVCSDMLAMALSSNTVVLIELSHADHVIKVQIPRKPADFTAHKIFMDPSGRHIITTSTQGENWYLFKTWKKPRQLKSFKMVIESIAWNKSALLSSSHSLSTREILIGARNGTIYEALLDAEEDFFKSQERYLQPVFSLPDRLPVTGIKFEYFPPGQNTRCLVMATTPSRIYQFVGVPDRRSEEARVFPALFNSYKDTAPKINELPGNIQYSDLCFYTHNADQAMSLPSLVAWLTGSGIYHGSLNFESNTDDLIDGAKLLPYPTGSSDKVEIPQAIALTEFHFILLYKDRILAVCTLDDKVTFEDAFPIRPNETVKGLASDPVRGTYWLFTDQSLFEIYVGNEGRDVWKIYLELGQFETALRHAKSAGHRDHILSAQADSFFAAGKFFLAAQCYSQCSISFEEVTLKFIDAGERDSLRAYLIARLERTRKSDLSQRMMLATWLVEFYLSKGNELDDVIAAESISQDVENLRTERTIIEEDLRHFFETYQSDLDPKTVYELTRSHGRTDVYLFYATIVGDNSRVIEHWVMEENWPKAIEVISGQSDLELYYRFSPVLMRHASKEAVDSWIRQSSLDPIRLIPAILQVQHAPRDPLSPNHVIRYLNYLVSEQGNTSSTIHNLLVTFHVSSTSASRNGGNDDDGPLLRYLSTAPSDPITGRPYYDLDYALRLCKQSGRTHPCVHIYSKMGLYENSVDLALEKGDVELAKINADMAEDDSQLRKKLWLKIARYVVQDKKDIKTAMRFLENTDQIKIEDILPFFPDFVVIDDFKEEIAHALEGYSAHIDALKSEMDDATKTAESIKADIAALKNRFVTIDAGEQCSVCSQLLLTRQFYVFPCRHTFHADCLIGLAKEFLPAHALRRIVALQNELVKGASTGPVDISQITNPSVIGTQPLNATPRQSSAPRTLLSANFGNGQRAANLLGRNLLSAGDRLRDLIIPDALAAVVSTPAWIPGIGGGKKSIAERGAGGEKAEKLRAELDELLASSCPLCESVVVGLDRSFVKEGEVDTTWAV